MAGYYVEGDPQCLGCGHKKHFGACNVLGCPCVPMLGKYLAKLPAPTPVATPEENTISPPGIIQSNQQHDAGSPPPPVATGEGMECEYCGPICYGGACHNARAEDNCRFGDLPGENAKAEGVALPKRPNIQIIPNHGTGMLAFYGASATERYMDALESRIAAEIAKNAELITEAASLRKRIHKIEGHNQWFERCESAWCNPDEKNNPALERFGSFSPSPSDPEGGAK